jgi:hypothetical protein
MMVFFLPKAAAIDSIVILQNKELSFQQVHD